MDINYVSRFVDATMRRVARLPVVAISTVATIAAAIVYVSGGNVTTASAQARLPEHHVVILIDSDDQKVMGHAISYSLNITRSFALKNESVKIEVVANGPGIAVFRADRSPLRQPLAMLRQTIPDIVFSMCESSKKIAEAKEGHPIVLIDGARLVPLGIGRVVDLEESGWTYIHG
ncbi:hypothetical protein [Rhizobium freirei]|nr:hypothetical protein [Rhizobium freirei]